MIEGREVWLSISGVAFEDGVVYAFRNLTEERALDELKGEFVATVSHELRTPLAAIYGSAQTLLRDDIEIDEDKRQRLLQVIAQESERLARVASDILLANRIDAGRLQLETRPSTPHVSQRTSSIRCASCFAERDDVTLELVAAEPGSFVAGDEDKLRQVLINLVDNAVKYSPGRRRGRDPRRAQRDESPGLSVSDEGLGIPHGEQQRIFGKFYRVDPQLSRGVGGTGLGLYICRELVRRMDGRHDGQLEGRRGLDLRRGAPTRCRAGGGAGRSGRAARLILRPAGSSARARRRAPARPLRRSPRRSGESRACG